MVDDNTLTVANASSAYALSPAEVGLSWQKIPSGSGSFPGPLDLPLGIEQKPESWILVFVVQDLVAPTDPVGLAGIVRAQLHWSASLPMVVETLFEPSDTPTIIRRNLGAAMGNAAWPAGVAYDGLLEGSDGLLFPALVMDQELELGIRIWAESDEPVSFSVGAMVAAQIPEPAVAGTLLLGGVLAVTRRRR